MTNDLRMFDVRGRFTKLNMLVNDRILETDISVTQDRIFLEMMLVALVNGEELCWIDVLYKDGEFSVIQSEGQEVHIALGIFESFKESLSNEINYLSRPAV